MSFIQEIENNIYVIIGLIVILVLLFYKSHSKNLETTNKKDIELFIEIILFGIIIIFIQVNLFSEHYYFIISLPIFIPIWILFINYLLSKHDIILIESRIQGEKFFEMGTIPENSGIKETLSLNTGILVHKMDKGYYEKLEHFGNPSTPFQNVGDRVKHCDYFNKKMVYHPENPLLHNITFWASQTTWITFKKVIPEIMNTNLVLTDLVDYKIQYHLDKMRENFPQALIGTESQYNHVPFDLEKSIQEKLKMLIAEYRKNLMENEEKTITENQENAKPGK